MSTYGDQKEKMCVNLLRKVKENENILHALHILLTAYPFPKRQFNSSQSDLTFWNYLRANTVMHAVWASN